MTAVASNRYAAFGPIDDLMGPDTSSIDAASEALRNGRCVVLAHDDEFGCDLVVAAEACTPEVMHDVISLGSGFVCVTVERERAEWLRLPVIGETGGASSYAGSMLVSVDAADGVTTGISARDRTTTVHALSSPVATHTDLRRPGHVVPVMMSPDAPYDRTSTIGALVQLATGSPCAVFSALVSPVADSAVATVDEAEHWASESGVPVVRAGQVRWRLSEW